MTPRLHPRRILMTTDAVGGVWTYALELSRGLGARGIEVVLATMGPRPTDDQRAEAAGLDNVTLCESEFRLEWMEAPWDDVERAGDWLLELEWRFAPDIVHLNGFAHGALPWSAPALIVAHSCVFSWWQAVLGAAPPASWSRYREAAARGIEAVDTLVAPTLAMLEALEVHYSSCSPLREQRDRQPVPVPALTRRAAGCSRSLVIPNGRDPSQYSPGENKESFVLSVGRLWDEAKNAAALAAIAPQLRWPVRVAGSTTAPDGRERGLSNVETLGCCRPRDLAAHYARASIYALPARYEPFGLSALEAALSGCALVLGDIPSLRENWEGAARFVPPGDHAALRDAINALIDDAALRRSLAERARARAGEFTSERMVDGYLAAYRDVTAARESPDQRSRASHVRPSRDAIAEGAAQPNFHLGSNQRPEPESHFERGARRAGCVGSRTYRA